MATTIQQPRNQVLDIAEVIQRLAPTFLGSGRTSAQQTNTATMDPAVAAQTNALIAQLTQRASSTAQADKVIEDILYRAQLAFAPVLGEEKQAGLYNTSTRNLLAKEAVARATAASAAAVLQDQQQAAATAAQLQGQQVQATGSRTTSSTQRTSPTVSGKKLLAGVGTGMATNFALKKGTEAVKKGAQSIYDSIRAPGAGYDSGPFEDISGNLYDPNNVESLFVDSGAVQSVGSAGEGNISTSYGGSEMLGAQQSIITGDDAAALQQLLDTTTIPYASEGVQVADAGGTTDAGAALMSFGAEAITMGPEDVVTSGSPAMPPAITVNPFTGNANVMPPAVQPEAAGVLMPPAVPVADAGLEGFEASMLEAGFAPDVVDPFSFDPTVLDFGADIGGEVVSTGLSTGLDAAASGADAAAAGSSLFNSMPIPYFAIANALTGGELGQAVADIPIVGDVITEVGEIVADIPVVGPAAAGFGQSLTNTIETAEDAFNDVGDIVESGVTGGLELTADLTENAFEEVGDLVENVGDSWIICTELNRQRRLPNRWYVYGSRVFAQYSEAGKQGYYIWAIPSVRHLRSKPNSWYSKFLEKIFNWRAEYLAAVAGAPKARKLLAGWFVTHSMYWLCWTLSKTIARKPIDWKVVYGR